MKNHALALGMAAALVATGACNKTDATRKRQAADRRGAKGGRQQDHCRRASRPTASSWPPPRPPGSTRRSPAPDPTRCSFPMTPPSPARRREFDIRPEIAPQLTGVLTNLILPGTVLVADIGKAIDNGKGKAVLATMGGGRSPRPRTATRSCITDAAGNKATSPRLTSNIPMASSTTSTPCCSRASLARQRRQWAIKPASKLTIPHRALGGLRRALFS